MLPIDADPVLIEARAIAVELRHSRRAVLEDCRRLRGEEAADRLRSALGSALGSASASEIERVVAGLPDELAPGVRDVTALQDRMTALLRRPAHRELVDRALAERALVLRTAARVRREDGERAARDAAIDAIAGSASASGRALTAAEERRIARLRREPEWHEWEGAVRSEAIRDGALVALARVRLREARAQLESGLLLTDQMRGIISEALPALRRGDPLLLVGETGGAKTALAEYLSERELGREPEFVSGYGDITSSQVIGAHELHAVEGATMSEFVPGPLLRAMTSGAPVILDEVNAMPAEFLKRLNRILQLRPGDVYAVQENGGRRVRVAPGFAVLATANEQTPHRYRGLDRLSAELVNRFGANSYRVRYPDAGRPYAQFPRENALLAAAAVVDRDGDLPRGVSAEQIGRVARAAFISQQVFAGEHGEGFADYVSTEREIDGRPGLEESVLAPRTLVSILRKTVGSAGAVTLDHALSRFVEGVMHREDRRVLTLILQGQGFRIS
ncbi:AAA family ATPase [Leucobacter sp. CSA1]|uniref:AAA family ATPase n=1 Tax=Leucobacter chromiisoli TaxID=2796471 RepID=A0A934UTW1_9MICO|nr:AAA family ATPase [Leucobacter chromiisoli]MBK0418160.1 AAA family ATPase [Leucobacter chromiisoli]